MASQSLNNSDESVRTDQPAVEEPNHEQHLQPPAEAATEQHEVNVDQLSESDFEGMRDSGLSYSDHDYIGSNPNAKCPPETAQFPILNGLTDQYINGETNDPCDERTDSRVPCPTPAIPASSSVVRKAQVSGGTVFRPAKGEDFAHPGQQPGVSGKSVSWKQQQPSNVTQPKKSGRPPKTEGDRLMGRAIMKAGMQSQLGHLQPHHQHLQNMHTMQEHGLTMRGAAPLVTPGRGQKITPRGRSAAVVRRDLDDGNAGYPMMTVNQPTPPNRSISPRKGLQFRSAQAAEEAHSREMMEAAQNALAPSNATLPLTVPLSTQSGLSLGQMEQQSIVLPVQHHQQPSHLDDGDLPRTPGKGHFYTPISSPLTRRTISESQEMNMHLNQEPLRSNADGLPVTPGGGRKTPGRPRTPRARTSTSESIPSGSQAISPQRPYMVSPTRQNVVVQSRSLHLSPHRQVMQGGHLKSPSSGASLSLAQGPSTMASAQLQMSSNAPIPSLHNQTYQQAPVAQRHVGPSPPARLYYDTHGVAPAPLITGSGSNTYSPRRRKDKESDEAVEAEVSRNVKTILLADKTHRLSTTSSHTLEGSDDDEIPRSRHVPQIVHDSRRQVSKRNSPIKPAKRGGQQSSQEENAEADEEGDWVVACICGQTEDDGEEMVACDRCIRWEHVDCIFPRTKQAPEGSFVCHSCWPRPTEITPEQARSYQDRVREEKRKEKERDVKEKLAERAKRKEESSRKSSSTGMRPAPLKGSTPKADKPSSHFREIEKNVYSPNARRLYRLSGGTGADAEIIKKLRADPRVRSLVVEPNIHGLIATKDIEDGEYIAELCGYVTLEKECPNRSLAPGSLNDLTFLYEKDGEKIVIDARKSGNFARHLRRSCKPNAELQDIMSGSELHIMIRAKDGAKIKPMEEVSIEFESDWRMHPKPAQRCACKERRTCEMERFFNQSKSVAASHRKSLPANGTTPKGARSPVRRAVTEKKKPVSAKKAVAKKGRKKGTIKLPRHSRKSKGGSTWTADEKESEGEEETEKEYEESTADEKEKEEVKEEKDVKEVKMTSRRGRRNTASTSDGKVKEEKEEGESEMPILTPTRSSTRIRNDSEMKKEKEKEMEDAIKEDKSEKSEVDRSLNETGGRKKGGRKSGVEKEKEKETEIKEELKEALATKNTKKKSATPKPWPVMDYTLPSERNKPSRDERKIQAALELLKKTEKLEKEKSRGSSSSRGRPTPVATPSGRSKRRTETETEDDWTPCIIVPPPRKRPFEDKETSSPAPSSLSSMTSLKEEPAASPVPSGGKKKWLQRHQQEQKEKEEKAAAEEAAKKEAASTPTRSKRKKEERGAVEALLNMGEVEEKKKKKEDLNEKMKKHAMQLRGTLKISAFSIGGKSGTSGRTSTPSTSISTAGPSTRTVLPPVSLPVTVPVISSVESAKTVKKTSLSIEEYRKRKQTGGNATVGDKKEESQKKEEPPKKSFMPSVDASSYVSSSLPNVNLPGLEETVGLDELTRRVYGETPRRGGSSTAVHTGNTEATPKRQSINDRLKNEFSLPIRNPALSVTTMPTPPAAVVAAAAPITPSISLTRGQLTPGGRSNKNRLSDARAMNVEPPGLIECPPPTSAPPPTTPRGASSTSVTPSTSATSFFQRAGSVRSSK